MALNASRIFRRSSQGASRDEGSAYVAPRFSSCDLSCHDRADSEGGAQDSVVLSGSCPLAEFDDALFGEFGGGVLDSLSGTSQFVNRVTDVLRFGDIFQILKSVVLAMAVFVVGLLTCRSRADEGRKDYERYAMVSWPFRIGEGDQEIAIGVWCLSEMDASFDVSACHFDSDVADIRHAVDPFVSRNGAPALCAFFYRLGRSAWREFFERTVDIRPSEPSDDQGYGSGRHVEFLGERGALFSVIRSTSYRFHLRRREFGGVSVPRHKVNPSIETLVVPWV